MRYDDKTILPDYNYTTEETAQILRRTRRTLERWRRLGIGPYLNAFETGSEARRGIGRWINYYNGDRPHSSHNGLTPNEAYETSWKGEKLAA
jgi:putative transposase